jgi:hypothetical protein
MSNTVSFAEVSNSLAPHELSHDKIENPQNVMTCWRVTKVILCRKMPDEMGTLKGLLRDLFSNM